MTQKEHEIVEKELEKLSKKGCTCDHLYGYCCNIHETLRDSKQIIKTLVGVEMAALVKFKLIEMPCCGHLLRWINPGIPNYCPECGSFVYTSLRHNYKSCIKERKDVLIKDLENVHSDTLP